MDDATINRMKASQEELPKRRQAVMLDTSMHASKVSHDGLTHAQVQAHSHASAYPAQSLNFFASTAQVT